VKNISLILNAVLAVAVIVLYILHFSSKSDSQAAETPASVSALPVNIAYIDADTLLKNYEFSKTAASELENKRDQLQAEYENRARGFQNEVQNFQRNAQNMTIAQAKAVEEDLGKKQQNLMQYQETLAQNLMQEEAKINNELYTNVSEFLKEYGSANNFQLVLRFQRGGGVLYANDSLNITQEVIKGLNQAYSEQMDSDTTATK